MKELSLRPYNGRVFYAATKAEYEKAHKRVFKTPDVLSCHQQGRLAGGEGHDGLWTYLVFADQPHTIAHELRMWCSMCLNAVASTRQTVLERHSATC